MNATLEKLTQEYAGRVELWEISADENLELLHQLKIYGIPTLIGYHNHVTNKIYVTHYSGRSVTVIDGMTSDTTTVTADSGAGAVEVNPVTGRVYVADQYVYKVTVIIP